MLKKTTVRSISVVPSISEGRPSIQQSEISSPQHDPRARQSSLAIATAKETVKSCRSALHETQQVARAKRQQHLEDIAALLKEARKTEISHIVQELRKMEEAADLARKVKGTTDHNKSGPIASILVHNHAHAWTRVSDVAEMEAAILAQNKQDLEYANKCPFLQKPLREYLGEMGDNTGADAMLRGEATVDTTN